MSDEFEMEILDKLDKITKILMYQVSTDKSMSENARILKTLGFDNKTIAEVLNTTDATVRTVTANLRKPRSKARK